MLWRLFLLIFKSINHIFQKITCAYFSDVTDNKADHPCKTEAAHCEGGVFGCYPIALYAMVRKMARYARAFCYFQSLCYRLLNFF